MAERFKAAVLSQDPAGKTVDGVTRPGILHRMAITARIAVYPVGLPCGSLL